MGRRIMGGQRSALLMSKTSTFGSLHFRAGREVWRRSFRSVATKATICGGWGFFPALHH